MLNSFPVGTSPVPLDAAGKLITKYVVKFQEEVTPEYKGRDRFFDDHEEVYGEDDPITLRSAGCHMIGAGVVEYYYSELSPKIIASYTNRYKMSQSQAETYKMHGPMDKVHAERSFVVLDSIVSEHTWPVIEQSVKDTFVATSLHYDGMLQAATGELPWQRFRDSARWQPLIFEII